MPWYCSDVSGTHPARIQTPGGHNQVTPPKVKRKIAKQRGKRGFGGPWRAFVRNRSLGATGTPDLRRLGALYKQAVAEGSIEDTIVRAGRAATLAGKAFTPKAGQSSFGPTQRDSKRLRRAALCRNLGQRTRVSGDIEQSALALGDALSHMGVGISTSLSVARTTLRDLAKREREEAAKVKQVLDRYAKEGGATAIANLAHTLPSLSEGFVWSPVPHPSGPCFEVLPCDGKAVSQAVSWAYESKESNASKYLKTFWAQSHQGLVEDGRQPATDDTHKQSECYKAGVCVCCSAGRELKKLRGSFMSVLKKACPHGSPERKALVEGDIVVQISAKPSGDHTDAYIDKDSPEREVFLHVGLMYLSPFRPTFMEVVPVPNPSGDVVRERRQFVQALCAVPPHTHRCDQHTSGHNSA